MAETVQPRQGGNPQDSHLAPTTSSSSNTDITSRLFVDDRGQPLQICISRTVKDSDALTRKIKLHGGQVTEDERAAYISLADPGHSYQRSLYSTKWVDRCIAEQTLLDHNIPEFQLKIGPSHEKVPFTSEQDAILSRYVKAKKAAGYGICGNKIYEEFAIEAPDGESPYKASKALREARLRSLASREVEMVRSRPAPPSSAVTDASQVVDLTEDNHAEHSGASRHLPEAISGASQHPPEATPGASQNLPEPIPGVSQHLQEPIPGASQHLQEPIPGASQHLPEAIPDASQHPPEAIPGASQHPPEAIPGASQHLPEMVELPSADDLSSGYQTQPSSPGLKFLDISSDEDDEMHKKEVANLRARNGSYSPRVTLLQPNVSAGSQNVRTEHKGGSSVDNHKDGTDDSHKQHGSNLGHVENPISRAAESSKQGRHLSLSPSRTNQASADSRIADGSRSRRSLPNMNREIQAPGLILRDRSEPTGTILDEDPNTHLQSETSPREMQNRMENEPTGDLPQFSPISSTWINPPQELLPLSESLPFQSLMVNYTEDIAEDVGTALHDVSMSTEIEITDEDDIEIERLILRKMDQISTNKQEPDDTEIADKDDEAIENLVLGKMNQVQASKSLGPGLNDIEAVDDDDKTVESSIMNGMNHTVATQQLEPEPGDIELTDEDDREIERLILSRMNRTTVTKPSIPEKRRVAAQEEQGIDQNSQVHYLERPTDTELSAQPVDEILSLSNFELPAKLLTGHSTSSKKHSKRSGTRSPGTSRTKGNTTSRLPGSAPPAVSIAKGKDDASISSTDKRPSSGSHPNEPPHAHEVEDLPSTSAPHSSSTLTGQMLAIKPVQSISSHGDAAERHRGQGQKEGQAKNQGQRQKEKQRQEQEQSNQRGEEQTTTSSSRQTTSETLIPTKRNTSNSALVDVDGFYNRDLGDDPEDVQEMEKRKKLRLFLEDKYQKQIRHLMVHKLILPPRAIDILDACSGNLGAAYKFLNDGMSSEIEELFWTREDDLQLLSADRDLSEAMVKKHSRNEAVKRRIYILETRAMASQFKAPTTPTSDTAGYLKRGLPKSRSGSALVTGANEDERPSLPKRQRLAS
ncbi:hypothetical protein BGX31_009886 [Mortierella sp. GBA43]|nr:hypothetical protein BGX31_009886 [Mortierella sp. GBA43]